MSVEPSLAERLTRLEEMFAHQEHVVEQLNELVIRLQRDSDALASRLRERIDRLETQLDEQTEASDPDEKPPHY